MSKINKKLTILIIFLFLVVLVGTFTKTSVDTKTAVKELKVPGLLIKFEDGISEQEVKAILESYNFTMNYNIEYSPDYVEDKYYIILDKDNWNIRSELSKKMKEEKKDWIVSSPVNVIRKGDNYILTISEQAIHDENFLTILDKYDIPVKKFIWYSIIFENPEGFRYWISEENAIRVKNELEKNEHIFSVHIEYIYE